MEFVCHAQSHVGRRKNNEDAFVVRPDLGLAVVADGMGGYEGGEVASALVVERMVDAFSRAPTDASLGAVGPRLTQLLQSKVAEGLADAHASIREQRSGRLSMMGSTAVVAAWAGDRIVVGNVGDSRVYRLRDGVLTRLTRDHSMLEEARAAGLGADNIRALGYGHMLTRAVGSPGPLVPDLYRRRMRAGDVFVLCSDGVWEPLTDPVLAEVLRRVPSADAAEALVRRAYAAGGADNMTALVLTVPRLST